MKETQIQIAIQRQRQMRNLYGLIITIALLIMTTLTYSAGELFPFYLPWDDASNTVINLRNLIPKPAGKFGFVFVDENSHLATTQGRIRFWGVNICFGADFPTHDHAEKIAARMAKYGINMVRFHHLDMFATPDGIWTSVYLDRFLDPVQMDKLDYFISRLKENGIYTDLNLLVSRPFHPGTELHPDINLMDDWKTRAVLGFFDQDVLDLQKQYAHDLLTHVNPYTGNAYINEAAVAFIEVNNENGLVHAFQNQQLDDLPDYYKSELQAQWNDWLSRKYASHDDLVTAWHVLDEPPGGEMLTNGDFSNGFVWPWSLEQHGDPPAEATVSVTSDGPGGSPSAKIEITRTGQVGWHVQFNQGGLDVQTDTPYTVTFQAKADSSRTTSIDMGMAHSPWGSLGFYKELNLIASWEQFEFTFALETADANARLNFSNMGRQTGTVWLADVSLKPGGTLGLYPDENLDAKTIRIFNRALENERTEAGRKDWYRFLLETEEQYWAVMRNYVKNTLGARSLMFGTIIGCSTPNVMANFDVIDSHAYWEHPVFPDIPWSQDDWYVGNSAMVNHPESAIVGHMSLENVLNKPHCVSEVNHCHPNTFQAEAFLLLSAYASLQDWDAVIPFCYSHRKDDWDARYVQNFFDLDQNPVKMASFIPAAAAFLRGDIRPADERVVVPISKEDEVEKLLTSWAWWLVTARSMGEDPRAGLIHRVEIAVEGQETPPGSLVPGVTDVSDPVLISDTGEIMWDLSVPGRGVMTVDTDASKFIVGFGGDRTFDLSGVHITPGATLQNGFGVLGLTVVEGDSVESARRIVFTALGATENTGMTWYEYPDTPVSFPPPEGINIALIDGYGMAPSVVEGIPATVVLPMASDDVRVWALDHIGGRAIEIPVTDKDGMTEFSVLPSYQSLWYEILHLRMIPGDLDGNGMVSVADLVILQNHLSRNLEDGMAPFIAPLSAADVDDNGEINAQDLMILSYYLVEHGDL